LEPSLQAVLIEESLGNEHLEERTNAEGAKDGDSRSQIGCGP
jgi:hypothetical protein